MKTDKIIFNNADDMATILRTGATLVDELGVCYDYVDALLNPYRFEGNHTEGAIDEQWDMCDGKTIFKNKSNIDLEEALILTPYSFKVRT